MSLALSEEQELLKSTAREFVREHSPVKELRRLRDSAGPGRLLARAVEADGASSAGRASSCPRSSAARGSATRSSASCSRSAAARSRRRRSCRPRCSAANALLLGGNETQQKEILPAVAKAERVLALALQEGPHHAPYAVATRAEASSNGYRAHGPARRSCSTATSRTSSSWSRARRARRASATVSSLFLVPKSARGLHDPAHDHGRRPQRRERARSTVSRWSVPRCVGHAGRGADVLDPVLDRATIGALGRDARHARRRPSSAPSRT